MNVENAKMIVEKFMCPGCTCGNSTSDCDRCNIISESMGDGVTGFTCSAWSAGTFSFPGGNIALGLPKGFNKVGQSKGSPWYIRIMDKPLTYDVFNIAIWGIIQDGYVFIRSYSPRINVTNIDIFPYVEGYVLPESCVDVAEFIDKID